MYYVKIYNYHVDSSGGLCIDYIGSVELFILYVHTYTYIYLLRLKTINVVEV